MCAVPRSQRRQYSLIKTPVDITSNKRHIFCIKTDNNLLTKARLIYSYNKFWNEVIIHNLTGDNAALAQYRILLSDKRVRSISYVQSFNINSYDILLNNFIFMWEIRDTEYHSLEIDSIIFTYKFPDKSTKWTKVKINEPQALKGVNKPAINTIKIGGYSLPNTMDLSLWGTIVYAPDGTRARIDRPRSKAVYEVIFSKDKKSYDVDITIDGRSTIQFKDTLESPLQPSTFKRVFKGKVYYYKDGELILKTIERKCKFLTKIIGSSHISNKFVTLDIETRTLDGKMIPYCVSIFDGTITKSFYLEDYADPDTMLKEAIYFLMRKNIINIRFTYIIFHISTAFSY